MTEPPPPPQEPGSGGGPRIRPFLDQAVGDASLPVESQETTGPARPRPFVLTAGRVRGSDPSIVNLETQVVARADRPPTDLTALHVSILNACATPLSVAEISAKLRIHFGVIRVIIGDLRSAGLLDVESVDASDSPSLDVIMRVMRGLRAMS